MLKQGISVAVAAVCLAHGTALGVTPLNKCEAAKNKVAGKYFFCRQKAQANAIKKGTLPDYAKCDALYLTKWMEAEANVGGICPTLGDQSPIQTCIEEHTSQMALALKHGGTCASGGLQETGQQQCDQGAGTFGNCSGSFPIRQDGAVLAGAVRSYTDNGNGTITDNVTGLMWEKLSNDGGIHDWTTGYNWYAAFNLKIATLNSTSFAGYSDWRLPNRNELQSLVNLGTFDPAADGAFNAGCVSGCTVTSCSCTQPDSYWSSTSLAQNPSDAWSVDFGLGDVSSVDKSSTEFVRAVRGGL